MVENIKSRKVNNNFLRVLRRDVKKIKIDKQLLVSADKTNITITCPAASSMKI